MVLVGLGVYAAVAELRFHKRRRQRAEENARYIAELKAWRRDLEILADDIDYEQL